MYIHQLYPHSVFVTVIAVSSKHTVIRVQCGSLFGDLKGPLYRYTTNPCLCWWPGHAHSDITVFVYDGSSLIYTCVYISIITYVYVVRPSSKDI